MYVLVKIEVIVILRVNILAVPIGISLKFELFKTYTL